MHLGPADEQRAVCARRNHPVVQGLLAVALPAGSQGLGVEGAYGRIAYDEDVVGGAEDGVARGVAQGSRTLGTLT